MRVVALFFVFPSLPSCFFPKAFPRPLPPVCGSEAARLVPFRAPLLPALPQLGRALAAPQRPRGRAGGRDGGRAYAPLRRGMALHCAQVSARRQGGEHGLRRWLRRGGVMAAAWWWRGRGRGVNSFPAPRRAQAPPSERRVCAAFGGRERAVGQKVTFCDAKGDLLRCVGGHIAMRKVTCWKM